MDLVERLCISVLMGCVIGSILSIVGELVHISDVWFWIILISSSVVSNVLFDLAGKVKLKGE